MDQLIVGGANFVAFLLLGRLAGADQLGVFALAMTGYYLMLTVQGSLITMPYTLFGARLKGAKHCQYSGAVLFQSMTWAVCVSTILAVVALWLFLIRGDASLAWVLATLALVSPLWLLREFGRRYLFVQMQVTRVLAMSVAGSTIQLLALGLFAYTGRLSAVTALWAMGFGSSVAACGWVWLNRRSFRFDRARSSYFLLKNWALGRWILGCEATSAVAANVMLWLIVFWLGPTATGIFAACDMILRFSNPIIISLTNVLTPNVAIGFSKEGKPAVRRIVRRASALLSLLLFLFCVLLVIAGELILERSFGDAYAAYWPVLAVLGLNQLVAGFALGPGQALLLLRRANIIFWAEVARFATSLVAAAVLIPHYGPLGAALSLLAGIVPFSAWIVSAYLAEMRDDEGRSQVSIGRASASSAPAGV